MVVLGKTVTCELATHVPSKTRNPHNLEHTPGGSSSGSAAAVADCMTPLAIGTQTVGSTIRPASFCGVVGYKPTFNLLSRAGCKTEGDSLDTVGVMARSVYAKAQAIGHRCRAMLGEAMGECDVLLAPSAPGEAPKGLASTGSPALNQIWTFLWTPTVTVPVHKGPNGLPVGLQVCGRIGDDPRTLAAAHWIHQRLAL